VEALTITVSNAWHGVQQVLGKRNRQPRPEIVIGAGHSTHASLIAGAWRHRARSIVLMNPSFPYALFDLCIVPKHDKVQARPNVLQSVGALNQVQVSTRRDPKLALILLGGPSRHFQWQHECVLTQIRKLLEARANDARARGAGECSIDEIRRHSLRLVDSKARPSIVGLGH
jgi:mitochondrial fission protein ELM1